MKTTRFNKLFLMIPVMGLLLASCSSVSNVVTDYDAGTDFSRFKTYNFWDDVKKTDDKPSYDQLDERRIKEAVAQSMESKGYEFTEEAPDLLANVRIMVKTKRNATSMNPYYGYWRFGGYNNININEYEEATILVDIVDANKNVLVWQGSIQSPTAKDPEERDRKIKDAVMKMFIKFDHRAGQSSSTSSSSE
ncbi:MAG: hypothetical protein CMO01_25855 [Thalassobius sp.]|nr:hypothetical protein [Thalassovita sp.]